MAQLDPSIPLNAMGANPNQPQQQMSNALQVFQMKDAMQQRSQAQQQQQNERRMAKKVESLANRGTGLFLKYRSLIDDAKLTHSAAEAAMQEDFKREIGGLASERDDNGMPLYTQEELQGLGQEFKAGELGQILPKLMGAKNAMDMYFKQQELKAAEGKAGIEGRKVAAVEDRNNIMRDRIANPPLPKPPPGHRYTADGSALERTPGGPAEQKFRADMAEDRAALDSGLSAIDATISNIDTLIGTDTKPEHPGLKAITGSIDSKTPTFFQDSQDAENIAEGLKSQASIQGLGNVRASSGSIGSLTQAEWPRLESLLVNLQQSQGTKQYADNLKKYRAELAIVKRRLQSKFKETYDGGGKMPEVQQPPDEPIEPIEVDW